ncbi:MAG: AAA family ATPase [Nitrospirota bacterium]
MQTQNETKWTDAEWREAKKIDADNAKARDAYIAELKTLLPQWIDDGMSEQQLYNMVSAWNEIKRPPLAAVEYIPLVEQAWSASQKKQRAPTEDTAKAEVEEKPEPPPLFKRVDSILNTPDQKYLIEPLLPMKGVVLVSALPAAGKTRLALSIAAAIVKQDTLLWHKYITERHGAVYLIDQENPTGYLKDNLTHYGITNADSFYISHFEGLNVATDYARIRDAILFTTEKMPVAIIFDSLIRMHTADENSAKEMNPIMQAFRNLSNDLDCLIMILHHDRKSAGNNLERARGSTDITAAVDVILSLSRNGDEVKLMPLIKRGKPAHSIDLRDEGVGFCIVNNRSVRTNEEIISDVLEGVELSTLEIKNEMDKKGYKLGRNQLVALLKRHFKEQRKGRYITWSIKQ